MAIKYLSESMLPFHASKTVEELKQESLENDVLFNELYNNRSEHDVFDADVVFTKSETLVSGESGHTHALTGRNTKHAKINSGIVMMENKDIVHITNSADLFGGGNGRIGVSHHGSVQRVEAVDVNDPLYLLSDKTTSIARDVVDVNQQSYQGNHHIDKPTLIVDQLSEPSTHTHDMIQDGNGRGIVIGAGADVYSGGGNDDAGHVNTLRSKVNVEVFGCLGVAVDYQDGSSVDLDFLAYDCAYGLVVRGGRWDVNHYFIRGMTSKTKYNPLYIEGNHGTQGTGYDNAVKYTTNSGHIDIKCYEYGKPIVIHGAPERLDLFAEQGAQKYDDGSYSYRHGNYCPVIFMPTASGINAQVVGDSVDPARVANFTIAGSDISKRYWRWPALVKQQPLMDEPIIYSRDTGKGVKFDVDSERNVTTRPHFSSQSYVGLKANAGTVLSGTFNTLKRGGEEVAVISDLPPASPDPVEMLRTDFEDGSLQGWSGVSLSVLEVANGTMRAAKADGAYDRVEFNATDLVIGNTYRATFTCHVSGSDPAARFTSWTNTNIVDVVVTSTTPSEYVIEFVPTDTTVKMRYYCDNAKNVTTDDFSMDLMVLESL